MPPSDEGNARPCIRIQPYYPAEALRLRIQGWVVLDLTVDARGIVERAEAVASGPEGYFEDAAEKSTLEWRWGSGEREIRRVLVEYVIEGEKPVTRP